MAFVQQGKQAAEEVESDLPVPAADRQPPRPPTAVRAVAPASRPSGFFTIYKKGQGKWTRLGTVFAAAFLGLLTTYNISFVYLPAYVHNRNLQLGIGLGFLAGFALLVFWLMNKATNAEFLISTDSEMKKVNWTTQGELIGSTRVVIAFLIAVALFLFVVDLIFAEFFHVITVLRTGPFH